ncbi:MAG: hypothetical protein HZA88_24190 [Verrucomicrobia bacterium]|nr:hypothetical protein [Verrucomicrobiota bacterium]
MKVTDVLVSHHAFLRGMFVAMEHALERVETVEEVRVVARVAEGLLRGHTEAEESLLFRSLDALLTEQGKTSQFYMQHKEHTALLKQAQTARSASEGRSDLLLAFRILRAHFHEEERLVLRVAQTAFQPESLETLGKAWLDRHALNGGVEPLAPS